MVRVVFKVNVGSVLMKRDYIFVQCIKAIVVMNVTVMMMVVMMIFIVAGKTGVRMIRNMSGNPLMLML